MNEILHAATAVSPRATSQGTAMFSLITAMDWPSFFFLNANAVGQSKQGKRDRYNKLHCLWISYCYLFDTIRTSGKRPLVLALFTSKNALTETSHAGSFKAGSVSNGMSKFDVCNKILDVRSEGGLHVETRWQISYRLYVNQVNECKDMSLLLNTIVQKFLFFHQTTSCY